MRLNQRGELLSVIAKTLQGRRDVYYEIAQANSGTVKNDSAIDIDDAIYTISAYAKLAARDLAHAQYEAGACSSPKYPAAAPCAFSRVGWS